MNKGSNSYTGVTKKTCHKKCNCKSCQQSEISPTCKDKFPKENISEHKNSCGRFKYLCQLCNQMIDSAIEDIHLYYCPAVIGDAIYTGSKTKADHNSRISNYGHKEMPKKTEEDMMKPRSAKCKYCRTAYNVDRLPTHEKECVYMPIECSSCFRDILLMDMDTHLCKRKKSKAKEPEIINLPDTEENSDTKDDNTKPNVRTFVSSEKQTDDLCIVKKNDMEYEELEAKSISKLLGDYKTMMTKGQNHDVTLKVKKQEFKAHKDLLCSRSPVFAAMFSHDTEENASGIVSIEDCDPGAFGEFLKFVYTGKVEIESVKSAIALCYIADKYDFEELKGMCVKYLEGNFTTTTICDVIDMARVHGETDLLESAVSFFSGNLEEILISVEWQRFLKMHTTVANELFIKAVKTAYKKL